jgi:4-hydroxybenzoyl-CoA thioesterase
MLVNAREVSIEWGMCDPAGIVFYPRYFEVFDNCLASLFLRATGLTKYQMLEKWQIAGFPSVETRAKFSKPCKFGDTVTVESTISEFRRSSFDIQHRLMHLDGTLSVEGFDTRVWTVRDAEGRIRSAPLPQDLIDAFK